MTFTRIMGAGSAGNNVQLGATNGQLDVFQRKAKSKESTGVTANVPGVVTSSAKTLMGWSVGEVASAAGVTKIAIVDGASATGNPRLATINAAANESETGWLGPNGITVTSNTLSIEHIVGEGNVTLYYSDI